MDDTFQFVSNIYLSFSSKSFISASFWKILTLPDTKSFFLENKSRSWIFDQKGHRYLDFMVLNV